MSVETTSEVVAPVQGTQAAFPPGQKLSCSACGSQIQILKPCDCHPPDQVLRCCGKDMTPSS